MTKNSEAPFPFFLWGLVIVSSLAFFSSCTSTKPIPYFRGTIDTNIIQKLNVPEQVVQSGDILTITIYSDNPEATAIYNQAGNTVPIASTASGSAISKPITMQNAPSGTPTYLVDKDGYIFMHAIGRINVHGMTLNQISAKVTQEIKKLNVLINPYSVVRFSSFKITVLGEVKSPGVFAVPGEKVSVFEAIGMAGDITDFGVKDRVIIIREVDGSRVYKSVDLLSQAGLASSDYYLMQNDVILVQSDGKKPTARDTQRFQYITAAAAVASTIAIFITIFK